MGDATEPDFSHPEFKCAKVDALPYSDLKLFDETTEVDKAVDKCMCIATKESCDTDNDRRAILQHTLAILDDLKAPEAAKEAVRQFSQEVFANQCQRLDNIWSKMNAIAVKSHLQQLAPPPPTPCDDNFQLDMNVTNDIDEEAMTWDDVGDDEEANSDVAAPVVTSADVDESGISDEDWEAYVKQICGDDY